MKQILLLIILFSTLKLVAQNPNAMVCRASVFNTMNTGAVPPNEPGKIIKDYYSFTVNIDTSKVKTFEPKFVYINCNGCEGVKGNHWYKLPLIMDTRNSFCKNSILDKYGKNILILAEREIYKQGDNDNDKKYFEQKLDNKYEGYYNKFPAILEVEINGQIEVLYSTFFYFIARP